jgi:translocation and assembly module TamB
MTRRQLLIRAAITSAAAAACLLIAAGAWLGSGDALAWASREIARRSGNAVSIEGAEGSLLGEVRIARLAIQGPDYQLDAESVVLDWQPWALLRGEVRLRRAAASALSYRSDLQASPEPPQSLALPVGITIDTLEISRLRVDNLPEFAGLRAGYSGGRDGHEFTLLRTRAADWRVDGAVRIAAQPPFAVDGQMQASRGTEAGAPRLRASAGGHIGALQLGISGDGQGSRIRIEAVLLPYAVQPLQRLAIEAADLDLSKWHEALPRTRLELEAAAAADQDMLHGNLRIENGIDGTLDSGRLPLTAANGEFSGRGDDWRLNRFALRFSGGGRITGRGVLRAGIGQADIRLQDIAASRIDSRLRPAKISGEAKLSGDSAAQQATALLQAAGLKLQFTARHAGEALQIDNARLQADSGSARFSATFGLTDRRTFTLDAQLARLDPSRLAAFPPASLNGRIAAQGSLEPGWQARVDADLVDSRLRGLPFSAHAAFSTGSTRLFDGTAEAAIGHNRLEVKGRYGLAQDRLAWSIDAGDLRAIDPALGGSLRGSGSVASGDAGPALDFTLSGKELAAGMHRVAVLEARGTLAAGRDGALDLSATAGGLNLYRQRIHTVQLAGSGSRSRHSLRASADGPDAAGLLQASGGMDAQGRWSGTLERMDIARPWPVRLLASAPVLAGPGLLAVEQLHASLLDGEFGPAALRAEDGRITTRGSFSRIAIGHWLPSGSGIASRDLRLGSQWSLVFGDTLSGNIRVMHESGDLALTGEASVALGLRKAMLNVAANENSIDVGLEVDSTAMGSASARLQSRVERRNGQWLLPGDAPLNGEANLDLRSLAWLRALLPGLDRIDGKLAMQVRAHGSAAAPRLNGSISGEGISLRALAPGLDLRDGRLRATLEDDRFRLDEFEIRAGKGRIVANGSAELASGLRSVDLQARAEQAQILLAPQWSAVVDGNGRLGFRDRRVTLDGKFRLEEGRYDLGAQRKPGLADDVVVRSPTTEIREKSPGLPLRLDLSLDLQDRLVVRGNGLDALLGGSLRVNSNGTALAAFGDVRTVRGHYTVFGQRLDIDRGSVTFGGPLADPGLDLRATRKIQTVEVGVEVTGSLQRPLVRLVSTPDMSDTDRMAWLALGRDPAGADRAQLALLQAAVLSLSSSGGKPVQRQFAEGVGLDEIGFAGGENGALGVVALGKHLTDRLSIRLEQTLGGTAGSLLRMDYLLSERWRLRGTAGAENAGDILFTLRFD